MGTETVQTYKVRIKFDDSVKKLQGMQDKLKRFNAQQQKMSKQKVRDMKASSTALADMLNKEQQTHLKSIATGKAEAAAERQRVAEKKRGVRLEERRLSNLIKAKEQVKNSTFWHKKEADQAHRTARANIKARMAKAGTAKQVRFIVKDEMATLNLLRLQTKQRVKQSFLLRRMGESGKQYAGNMVGAFAIAAGGAAVVNIGQDMEAAAIAMEAATGNAEEGAKQMAFARREAKRLGLDIVKTTQDYAKLFAAGEGKVSTEEIQGIFLGVAEASTVMGLSMDDSAGAIRAIQQMMSKGKIQAEELRMQLGDRMSPAFKLMAKAVGVGTEELDKMMEQGKLLSAEVLPKFGKNLREFAANGLDKSLKSNRKAMQFMGNAWKEAAETMFEPMSAGLTDLFISIMKFFDSTSGLWKAIGATFGAAFKVLAVTVKTITWLLSGLSRVLESVVDTFGELTALMTVPIAFMLVPALRTIATGFLGAGTATSLFNTALKRLIVTAKILSRAFLPVLAAMAAITAFMDTFDFFNSVMEEGAVKASRSRMESGQVAGGFKPILLNATLNVDGEVMAQRVVKSPSLSNKIDDQMYLNNGI